MSLSLSSGPAISTSECSAMKSQLTFNPEVLTCCILYNQWLLFDPASHLWTFEQFEEQSGLKWLCTLKWPSTPSIGWIIVDGRQGGAAGATSHTNAVILSKLMQRVKAQLCVLSPVLRHDCQLWSCSTDNLSVSLLGWHKSTAGEYQHQTHWLDSTQHTIMFWIMAKSTSLPILLNRLGITNTSPTFIGNC